MIKKLSKILLLVAIISTLILPINSFAETANPLVLKTTSKSTVLDKELQLNRTTQVDMNAVHAYLAKIDKDLKEKTSVNSTRAIIQNVIVDDGASSYGAAWSYTANSSGSVNCYGYASRFNAFVNPGVYTFYYGSPLNTRGTTASVDSIAGWVLTDLGRCGRISRIISSSTAYVNSNEYRIAVRTGSYNGTWDYHFMLQCSNGGWCEKPGPAATKYDGMVNPSTFSWDLHYTDGSVYRYGFYNSNIIYIAVKY